MNDVLDGRRVLRSVNSVEQRPLLGFLVNLMFLVMIFLLWSLSGVQAVLYHRHAFPCRF